MRFLLLVLLVSQFSFGADPKSVDGEGKKMECLTLIVQDALKKTEYKDVTITKITEESSYWGYYEFEAENGKKDRFRGYIYAEIWNKDQKTLGKINREVPLLVPHAARMTAFQFKDNDDKQLYALSTIVHVKGKRFGYAYGK